MDANAAWGDFHKGDKVFSPCYGYGTVDVVVKYNDEIREVRVRFKDNRYEIFRDPRLSTDYGIKSLYMVDEELEKALGILMSHS